MGVVLFFLGFPVLEKEWQELGLMLSNGSSKGAILMNIQAVNRCYGPLVRACDNAAN